MENTLTKTSAENDIKSYFEGVLSLSQNNEQYPVNLDDVWPLIYNDKGHAVRALKAGFVEGDDYQVVTINGNKVRSSFEYKLTVSCLEFFIAKKVRPVFEVYRQVFHKVAEPQPMTALEALAQQAQFLAQSVQQMAQIEKKQLEQDARIKAIEDKQQALTEERERNGQLLLSTELSNEETPALTERNKVRMLVNQYAAASNTSQQDIWHEIYKQLYYKYGVSINAYPKTEKESKLDVAEKHGFIHYIYNIISGIVGK